MAQTNESQEQVTVNVETLQPVTRTLMTIGALPTSYLISMTYEEQLLWLQNYLIKTVIPAINNNAEATQEVQDIVMALQDYINDYFNNLDVQEEINNKLDDLVEDGTLTRLIGEYVQPLIDEQNQEINTFKNQVNNQIAAQNTQIQAIESGSPLVASSVSGMTDTTRVYVNTTDGYWYYYNGTNWVQGGVYQSTGIADNSINYIKLDDKTKSMLSIKIPEITTESGFISAGGNLTTSNDYKHTSLIHLKENETISANLKGTINAQGNPRVSVISIVQNNLYEVAVTNNGTDLKEYSYTATRECDVILSTYDSTLEIKPVIYKNLDSINNEILKLKQSISYSLNENGYVSYLTGNVNSDNRYMYSNLIPILNTGKIILRSLKNMMISLSGPGVAFYDKNTNFISGVQLPVANFLELTIPANAEFMRFCKLNDTIITEIYYKNIIDSNTETTLNNREIIDDKIYYDFSMFKNLGVIGDSYASGVFANSEDVVTTHHYDYSWPKMLQKKYGFNLENFSAGGLSTRTWITDTNVGLSKVLATQKQDIYILALERNDYGIEFGGETGYLGNITDITSHSLGNYPDTFYGNYATIIENILNYSPNSKLLMMVGDFKNALGISYNEAMVEIAEHYNIPVIKQLDDKFFNTEYYNDHWPHGYHPGTIQYNGMSNAIERLFDKCVKNNLEYFKYLGNIE